MSRPPATDPRRTLTLRDVSEASGVSEMTVSRVLRNRGDVSEATREKVLKAARDLGYVPNKIAGALASQRVNLVAVIIPSMSNMVFPEVMTGISETLEDTGLQPVVGITNDAPEREEAVLYEMLSWRPSGVIVAGLEHTPAARSMLESAGSRLWRSWISTASRLTVPWGFPTAGPDCRWLKPSPGQATAGSVFWARKCRMTIGHANGWKGFAKGWRKRAWVSPTRNIMQADRRF